jgi:hypothetical protein
MMDLDSPDMMLPRQTIAKGTTPIAARESVVRYQMSMKEDDYTYIEKFKYLQFMLHKKDKSSINYIKWN